MKLMSIKLVISPVLWQDNQSLPGERNSQLFTVTTEQGKVTLLKCVYFNIRNSVLLLQLLTNGE